MKKIFMIVAALLFGMSAIFAQVETFGADDTAVADRTTQRIVVEETYPDLHPKAKDIIVELEYIPLTGEVHLYYTCNQSAFDEGEAMNTAMAIYDDFAAEHKYKHKRYVAKDKTKFFKDENKVRKAQYISYVIFTK